MIPALNQRNSDHGIARVNPTDSKSMQGFDFQPHTRVVFGKGTLQGLGQLARELGFRRTLLVADRGLVAIGYVQQAKGLLKESGIQV